MTELTQLEIKDVAAFRETLLEKQGGLCALSGEYIVGDGGVSLDHQHKFKRETNGVDGAGCIRAVLSRDMNLLEGKIWNNTSRYLNPKSVAERIEFLESLIDFYKKGTLPFIHPSEKVKEKKVSKSNYNLLLKLYNKENENKKKFKKFPDYPKSFKLTKALKVLFEQFDIEPYN